MLFRLSRGDPDTDLYLYSETDNERAIRSAFSHQDQGSMPWKEFNLTATDGEITWVKTLADVPKEHYGWMPYTTDHFAESDELLDIYQGLTVEDFFNGQA